jgi:type I restriction enzyme R subunit
MKHRESNTGGNEQVKLNLKDEIHKKEFVEFGPEHEALSIAKYRELVETRVRELVDKNPVLQKVSRGEAITKTEVEELARMLYEDHPHITVDLLRRVYDNRKAKFLQFIKHILGIEKLESFPESVSKSIDIFVQRHANLTSRQLEFLELLRGYIIDRGGFEKRDLIQSPFTQLHPEGIRGVFTPAEIDEILELTKELVA